MERTFEAATVAPPDQLYAVLADLATYPEWLALAHRVEPEDGGPSGGDEPSWLVTLRARVGPLARSKRLRMVRTHSDGSTVRFERRELDGRDHSTWTLEARVDPIDDAPLQSRARLMLSYGGRLWSKPLDAVLDASAETAARDLQDYAADLAPA